MKKIGATLYLILAVSICTAIAISFNNLMDESQPKSYPEQGEAFTKEYLRWQFMRLRDPKTGKIPEGITRNSLEYVKTLPGAYDRNAKSGNRVQSNNWRLRGPNYWGGRTRALGIDISDENIMLAGGVTGGMWRSMDAGKTWALTTEPDDLHSISCIVQDTRPGKENVWYYGTGEFRSSIRLLGNGIFKSVDAGMTWHQLESTTTKGVTSFDNKFDYVWELVIDPTATEDQTVLLAAITIGGIYRSIDGGNSWEAVLGRFGNGYSYYTDIAVSSTGVFYATMSQLSFYPDDTYVKGIFRSDDGINWTDITPENWPEKYSRIEIAIAPSDENQVYFVAETPDFGKWTTNSRGNDLWHSLWKYTYVSGDGAGEGGVWEDRTNSIPSPELVRHHMNSQSSYNLVIQVKPDDPDVVIMGATNLYRSTNGFKDTTTTTIIGGTCPSQECDYFYRYPNHHSDQHAIHFLLSNPDIMLTGTDGGVHKTLDVMADSVVWISLNEGYITTQFFTCAIDHGDNLSTKIIGGLQDNGTLFCNADNVLTPWTSVLRADGFFCRIADGGEIMYASQNSSRQPMIRIWKIKVDENGEKIAERRIDPIGGEDFIWNTPYLLDPNDNTKMYVAGGKIIWRNNNLDEIPLDGSKDSTSINWDSLQYTRVDSINPVNGFAEAITAVGISKAPANVLYYGTSFGRIFKLEDANSGQPVPIEITGDDFPGAYIGCIFVDPEDAGQVIVSFTNFRVQSIFYTSDGGAAWTPISGNLEEGAEGAGNGPGLNWIEMVKLNNKKMYFAGTTAGLYSTANLDGEYTIWQQEGAVEIGNVWVDMLDARSSDGFMAVATHGAGMYSGFVNSIPVPPGRPVLTLPLDGAENIPSYDFFTWEPVENAVHYKLEIATDPEFKEMIYVENGITDTIHTGLNLKIGFITHYWRVIAKNAGGDGIASDTRTFQTIIGPPDLVYPENYETALPFSLTLRWNPAKRADSYHVQVATNIFFSKIFVDSTGLSSTELDIKGLEENKRYYWRTSSISDTMESKYSKTWNFNTKDPSQVEELHRAKNNIKIYPNPSGSITNMEFFLPRNMNLRIAIYDYNGKYIRRIKNGYFTYGLNRIQFDNSDLANGNYYIQMTGKNYRKTRTFTVIR